MRILQSLRPLLAVLVAFAFVLGSPGLASAANPVDIRNQWVDRDGRSIYLRYGIYDSKSKKGFGWEKISRKHAILNNNTVKNVTLSTSSVKEGTDRTYYAYARVKKCYQRGKFCEYTHERQVKAVVGFGTAKNYHQVNLNGRVIGVKTTYCVNPGGAEKCPEWVERALAGTVKTKTTVYDESMQFNSGYETSYTTNGDQIYTLSEFGYEAGDVQYVDDTGFGTDSPEDYYEGPTRPPYVYDDPVPPVN